MAVQVLLIDPAGTQYDITSRLSEEGLPDLSLQIEDDSGSERMVTGDMTFCGTNHDGWWEETLLWTTEDLHPEDRYDEATALGIWTVQIWKAGALRWDGDVDYASIQFDRKLDHRVVTFSARGILSRYERYNAAKIYRVDPDALAAVTWTTDRKAHARIMTCSATIASLSLAVGDVLHATKLKLNGKVIGQDLPIKATSAEDATLTAYQVRVKKRLKMDLNNEAGVVCTTPYWRGLTPAQLAAKLWDWMGVPAARQHCDYTAQTDDTIPYADWAGKSVADAFDELAKLVPAVNFGRADGYYFQGRDKPLAGKTATNIDALLDARTDGTVWDQFTNLVVVKAKQRTSAQREGSDDVSRRCGGLVYPQNQMEVSTDYAVSGAKLDLIAQALYSWFGSRRRPMEVTVRDDGTVYDLWDPVEVTVLGTPITLYVQEVTEPLRSVDGILSEIQLKLVAAVGVAPTTGDGEMDDQSIDDSDPEPPAIVWFGKDKSNSYWKTGRSLFPAEDSEGRLIRPRQLKEWVPVSDDNEKWELRPTKVLHFMVWRWDQDDPGGRLLGFHLAFWADNGDIDKPDKEKNSRNCILHTDGNYYLPVYLGHKAPHEGTVYAVLEDGRMSAPAEEQGAAPDVPTVAKVLRLSRTFSLTNSGLYAYDPSNGTWALEAPPGVYHIKPDYVPWPVGARFVYGQTGQCLAQLWRRSPDQATCLSVSFDLSATWSLCVLPAGYVINGVGERFVSISEAGNGKTIYAVAMASDGSYHCLRSPDAGATWHEGGTDVHFGNASYPVASPADASRVYVTRLINMINCLFKSEDGGDTFTATTSFPDTTGLPTILAMPQSAGSLLVITTGNNRLWSTTDGGVTWSDNIHPTHATYGLDPVVLLVYDPGDPNTIFCTGRLYDSHSALVGWWFAKSTKGMATVSADWTVYPFLGTAYYPRQIVIDPFNGLNIYISVAGSPFVLVSNDGGITWAPITVPFPGGDDGIFDPDQGLCVFGQIGAAPQDKTPVYAAGYNGANQARSLWESTDEGQSFTRVWQDSSIAMAGPWACLAREPDDATGQTLYRGMEGDAAKVSANEGADWDKWLGLGQKWRKIVAPASSAYAYVVDHPGSLFRTTTRKNSAPIPWLKIGPAGVTLASACFDAGDSKKVYGLGDNGNLYTCLDATANYPEWDAGVATGFAAGNALEVICPSAGVLWVSGVRQVIGGASTVLRHSVDGGATWTTPTDPAVGITQVDVGQLYVSAAGTLFVLSSAGTLGLWRSTDAGVTWTHPYSALKCYGIAAIPSLGGGLFMGCDGLIQLSGDDGTTWTPGGSTGDVSKKFLAVC